MLMIESVKPLLAVGMYTYMLFDVAVVLVAKIIGKDWMIPEIYSFVVTVNIAYSDTMPMMMCI